MNNVYDQGCNPCSSCGVCAVTCPKECIIIRHDEEGFYRPLIDEDICISCGICKKVCYQYLPQMETFRNYFENKAIYGTWSKNEQTRLNSSSGGVGHELIKTALQDGYNACGVVFDIEKDTCKHQVAKTKQEAERFKSSKYLQSYTPEAFIQFQKDQKYIVVGTPCQIYGLREWLKMKKWEGNFILVDFFCHGTPTQLLWQKYKQYIQDKHGLGELKEIVFRSKEKSSWHKNAMKISDQQNNTYYKDRAFTDDLFFKFFLSDACLNDACYSCLLRLDYCSSDIRLADFWGEKYREDKQGVTLVSINTEQGKRFYEKIVNDLVVENCIFSDLQQSQPKRFHHKIKSAKMMNMLSSDFKLKKIYQLTIQPPIVFRLRSIVRKARRKLTN